jgi:hypothetical protein
MSDVTRILDAIQAGEPQAASELLPLVYGELRKLAAQKKGVQTLKVSDTKSSSIAGSVTVDVL